MESEPGKATNGFALVVALAGFMEFLDGSVIQTALKRIGFSFGVAPEAVAVAMSVYFAAVAATIPITSWLANRVGVRRAFIWGTVIFTLASVACGFSVNLPLLLVFRVVQGIGGACMLAIGQLSVLRNAAKGQLLNVTAYLIWPALIAPVLAPPIGGVITEVFGWRWLFFINLPIGIVLVLFALRLAPKADEPLAGDKKLDGVGAILLSLGLFTLIPALGIVDAGNNILRIGAIAVGLLLCTAAVIWMIKTPNPLLDFSLFKVNTFGVSNFGGAIYRLVIATVPVILTLMLQNAFGWSPAIAGVTVMWLFVGNVGIKPIANYLVRKHGFRAVILGATIVDAMALGVLAYSNTGQPVWVLPVVLVVSGSARSIGFTAYNNLQFADVPKTRMDHASPLSNSIGQLAYAVGIAIFVGMVALFGHYLKGQVVFAATFWVMAVVVCASALGTVSLPKHAGSSAYKA